MKPHKKWIVSAVCLIYVGIPGASAQDGNVVTLQQSTRAKGIDVVLMGDGFTHKEMKPGGRYEKIMRVTMEAFFSEEPVRTFRDYFNVYAVEAVSQSDSPGFGANTCFGANPDDLPKTNYSKCLEYARKAPLISRDTVIVVLIINTEKSRGNCRYVSAGIAFAQVNMFRKGKSFADRNYFRNIVAHEAVGHGLGRLADEYVDRDGTTPEDDKDRRMSLSERYGSNANIDFVSHPKHVKWSHFVDHPNYPEVGIFEGANRYPKGAYRPTINSLMRGSQGSDVGFNAPSREAIYRRIKELSGEIYKWDDFFGYDAINRTEARRARFRTPPPRRTTR